jgi:hypothetical protein
MMGEFPMTTWSVRALAACLSIFVLNGAAGAIAAPITEQVKNACATDYKKYCGEYGLETAALRSCMDRNGKKLSKPCVNALVHGGQVSQAEVDRRKKGN